MTASTFIGHFLGPDTHANRPSATGLPNGTLYACTTHGKLERVVSGAWADYFTGGGSAATDTIYDAKGDIIAGTGPDAAARVAVGTDGQILVADSSQSAGVRWGAAAAGDLVLLSTTTLSSDGIIDVSGISGSYSDLVCQLIARSAAAGSTNETPAIRFNNDSGTNYYQERLRANSSAASATENRTLSAMFAGYLPQASAIANSFGVMELTLPGYASTSWYKTMIWRSYSMANTTTANLDFTAGGSQWQSTAAVTRIQVMNASFGNLQSGSLLRIYGRK